MQVDHLVYTVPDVAEAVGRLAQRTGVTAIRGGQHPGLGTHNALLSLSHGAYLEIIGPDPSQPPPVGPRPFGIDSLAAPRLATWAVKAPDLDARVERARMAGYDPGSVITLSRTQPDGRRLEWRLTFAVQPAGDGLVPFLIDWGTTLHPAHRAPRGCTLAALRGEHPQPESLRVPLQALGVDLPVTAGVAPALVATIETPKGRLELR